MTPTQEESADGTASSGERGAPAPAPMNSSIDQTKLLEWYYARLFPIDTFSRWLSYGSESYLSRREISFTLAGDIYIRWRSFLNSTELHTALKKQKPIKIDVGAVYNFQPANRHTISTALTPVSKEFVLDIDMTDYLDVLNPSSEPADPTSHCDAHWSYMALAVRVLDAALREDFGFKHIMWVYSGRRGVHAWICDARARAMNNQSRGAVADYLAIRFEGRTHAGRRNTETTLPLHPALQRAKGECVPLFQEETLSRQQMLSGAQAGRILSEIPNEGVRRSCAEKIRDERTGAVERWTKLEKEVVKAGQKDFNLKGVCDYVVLKYTYPRLDVNVSKEINHLLKAPFCVHPKTGRVCVPFNASDVDNFRPERDVPIARKLIAEIEQVGPETEKMSRAVALFESFVKNVLIECREIGREEALERMDERGARELIAT